MSVLCVTPAAIFLPVGSEAEDHRERRRPDESRHHRPVQERGEIHLRHFLAPQSSSYQVV